jgi:hypothetical protein
MSTQTSPSNKRTGGGGFGPRRLAGYATAHPKRVLAIWGLLALVGIALTNGLLSSALTTDSGATSKPESQRAQDLIDERLPNVNVEGESAAAARTVTQFDAAGYAASVAGEQLPTPAAAADAANGADKDRTATANPAALD